MRSFSRGKMSELRIFYISIADLTVEIQSRSEFSAEHCRDFIAHNKNTADIVAKASLSDISEEKKHSGAEFSDGYCENICIYRSIAEQLPRFDSMVMHGASVSVDGKGYIFSAPSGTGKTTHLRLWLEHLGERATVINGDKPILKKKDDCIEICSNPWAGKERMKNDIRAPLCGFCLIRRGRENKIKRIDPAKHFDDILRQFYIPKDPVALSRTFDIIEHIAKAVPFYLLECDMSKEAFITSYEAMSGEKYKK